ncbi:hypothetical protein ACN75_27310 [Escherichia coli]|nr:hypothetical protein ACN75_27310 [Escherichia coli]
MTDAYGATHLVFSGHRTKEGKQKIRNWGFRISVLKIRSSPHAWLNFILFSTTFIIMNSHIEIGKQKQYFNNKYLISMQVVDVESVTSFGDRND